MVKERPSFERLKWLLVGEGMSMAGLIAGEALYLFLVAGAEVDRYIPIQQRGRELIQVT